MASAIFFLDLKGKVLGSVFFFPPVVYELVKIDRGGIDC
jgi:hypothetical protein